MTIWVLVILVVLAAVLVPAGLIAYTLRRAGDAEITTCEPTEVPPSFGSSVAELVQLGFVVAGAVRVTNRRLPDAYVVLFANVDHGTYGRLWVSAAGSSQYSLTSPLRRGAETVGSLTTALESPTSTDPTELQQVFPGASISELVTHHLDAQRYLIGRGVGVGEVAAEQAEELFRSRWSLDVTAARRGGLRVMAEVVVRILLRRPRYLGPLAAQADLDERLVALDAG